MGSDQPEPYARVCCSARARNSGLRQEEHQMVGQDQLLRTESQHRCRVSWRAFLENQFRSSCSEEASRLDGLLELHRHQGTTDPDLASISLDCILRQRVVLFCLVCLSLFSILFGILPEVQRMSSHAEGSVFRLSVLTHGPHQTSISNLSTGNFAIRSKCGFVAPTNQSIQGAAVTMFFSDPIVADGWKCEVPADLKDDADEWKLEVKTETHRDFKMLGRFTRGCQHALVSSRPNGAISIEHALFNSASVSSTLATILCALGSAVAVGLSISGRILDAGRAVVVTLSLLTLLALTACLLAATEAKQTLALRWGHTALLAGLVTPCLAWKGLQRFVCCACIISGAVVCALESALAAGKLGHCGDLASMLSHPNIYAASLLLGVGFCLRMRCCRAISVTRARMDKFRARFQAVWAERQAQAPADIARLASLMAEAAATCNRPGPLLQQYPLASGPQHAVSTSGGSRARVPFGAAASTGGDSSRAGSLGAQSFASLRSHSSAGSSSRSLHHHRGTNSPAGTSPSRSSSSRSVDTSTSRSSSARSLSGFVKLRRWWTLGAIPSRPPAENSSEESMAEVKSLDQLYALAGGAAELLRCKVQQLARNHSGLLAVAPGPSESPSTRCFVRWSAALTTRSARQRVKWTPLKPERRAVEKTLHRYGGRCARMLDVSRESAVFESEADICEAIREILTDPDVEVARIVDSMDLASGESSSSGFQPGAVVLSLRFVSDEAKSLGLHGHICELRLVLLPFAASLTEREYEEYHHCLRQLRADAEHPNQAPASLGWFSWSVFRAAARVAPDPHAFEDSGSASFASKTRHAWVSPSEQPAIVSVTALAPTSGQCPGDTDVMQAVPPPAPESARLPLEVHVDSGEPRPSPNSSGPAVLNEATSKGSNHPSPSPTRHPSTGAIGLVLPRSWTLGHNRGAQQQLQRMNLNAEAEWPEVLGPKQAQRVGTGEEATAAESLPAEALLQQFRLRALRCGPGELYERAPTLRESMDRCQAVSVLSTSFPIAAAMRKNYVPLFILMLACASGWKLPAFHLSNAARGRMVRFSALQLRAEIAGSGLRPLSAPVIADFELRMDGCRVHPRGDTRVSDDLRGYTLAFVEEVAFDEVHFRTLQSGSPELDPVTFAVEVSQDGAAWEQVAASRKVLRRDGSVRFDRVPSGSVPERGGTVKVSLQPKWFIGEIIVDVLSGAFAVGITTLWVLRKYELGRYACLSFGVGLGLEQLLCGSARLALGYYMVFPLEFIRAAAYLGCTFWLSLRESHVLEVLMTDSLVNCVTFFVHYLVFDPVDVPGNLSLLISSACVPLMCLALIAVKYQKRSAAFERVREDFSQYQHVWHALTADPAHREGCRRIAATITQLPSVSHFFAGAGKPHQTYHSLEETNGASCGCATALSDSAEALGATEETRATECTDWVVDVGGQTQRATPLEAGTVGAGFSQTGRMALRRVSQIASLGTEALSHLGCISAGDGVRRMKAHGAKRVRTVGLLYRQASGVYYLARQRIRAWCEAAPAGALVPAKGAGALQFVHVTGSGGGRGVQRGVEEEERAKSSGWAAAEKKLPPLKKVDRATQKLMRAYDADASRLLDVVRFGLVFASAHELADMLEVVARDPEVHVVAAKNRFRDGYHAKQSAGFRDVHLNLVIETEEAIRLGIHTHVWELQLTLLEICKLRSDGGHQRYVQYRDLKAE